jgi:hypothetical protein
MKSVIKRIIKCEFSIINVTWVWNLVSRCKKCNSIHVLSEQPRDCRREVEFSGKWIASDCAYKTLLNFEQYFAEHILIYHRPVQEMSPRFGATRSAASTREIRRPRGAQSSLASEAAAKEHSRRKDIARAKRHGKAEQEKHDVRMNTGTTCLSQPAEICQKYTEPFICLVVNSQYIRANFAPKILFCY